MARQLSNPVYLASPEKGVDGRGILTGARAPLMTDGRIGDFWLDSRTDQQKLYGPKNAGAWPDLGFIKGNRGWTPVFAAVADGVRRVQRVVDWQGGEGPKPATGKYVGASGLVDAIGDALDIRGPEGPEMVIDALDAASTAITDATQLPVADPANDNEKRSVVEVFSLGALLERQTLAAAAATTIDRAVKRVRTQFHSPDYAVPSTVKGGATYIRVNSEPSHGGKFRSTDRWMADGNADSTNGGWWEINEPELTPPMFGARGRGDTGVDDTAPLVLMKAVAAALKRPMKIDGIYRRKSQWVPAAGADIGPATDDAKIIFQIGTNSACVLVLVSNCVFRKGLEIELDYRLANGDPGPVIGPFGTMFTVGRDAYASTAPAVISNVTISCTTRRPDGTPGNNISILGNVERVKCDATVYGGGAPVTIGPNTYESNGFIAHWGAHSSLTTIATNSYHPRHIDIDGLHVENAGAPVKLSSVYNVTGHFTGANCTKALYILPGDNAADYAEAAYKPLVGSGIDVSFHVTGCLPDKPILITSLGNSPFDGKLHTLPWRGLKVKGYMRLATPSTSEQICDIENLIGSGKFSIVLENVGDGPGFALERVVGDFVLEDCESDSAKQGAIVVRCRGVKFINPQFRRARMLGAVTTTHGIDAIGQKIEKALGANLALGATTLTLASAFGQRCMPGDIIHVTTGGRMRACYVTEPADTTATTITIKATDFAASSGDVVALRTDLADFEVKGGTISGHYYGIGINRGQATTEANSFLMEGVAIEGVDFREIAHQALPLFQARQFSVKGCRETDCGVGRVVNGALTTRFANFDRCAIGRIRDNCVNSDSSPNMYYAFVNNAACTDLQITGNAIGTLASGGAAFSAANQAGNTYASNFFLDGTAATP